MAEETTNLTDALEGGMDQTTNPVTVFREAMAYTNLGLPNGEPAGVRAMLNTSGNYKTGPNPPTPSRNGTLDSVNNRLDYMAQASSWAKDPNYYGRALVYGAGIHGANFERYYNHPKFKELGFNPTRNNEIIYNEKSSWLDDFKRMTGSAVDLAYTGFKSPFDFGSKNTAYEFDKAMAEGMSTKDDFGAFFTNLGLNSAFTLGLLGEMVAENFAMAGAAYLTRGAALPGMAAATVGRDAMGVKKLHQFTDMMKSMKELTKKLLNPATAGDFYKKANSTTFLGKTANFLNPLSHTTDYIRNVGKAANGVDKLNDFAKTRKAFGAFYRDLREMNLTVSESLMEGQMASNEKNRKKIDDFYRKNGYMPEGKDAENIYNESNSTGFAISMANIPTIFLTNRLVFDNLFKGFKPPSVVGKEMIEGTARTMTKSKGWKLGDDVYSFYERGAKNKLSKMLYDNPYVPWGKAYMLGNLAEGVQELSQEIVSASASKYYEKLYSDPTAAGLYNALVAIGQGTGEQFNKKGLETFLSGYLTGSVVQATGKIFTAHQWAPGLYKEYFKKEDVQREINTQRERENQIMNAVNTVLKDPLGYFDQNVEHALRVRQLSNGMEQAQMDGDQKSFHDNKNDLLYEHLYTAANTGKMDMIVEQLDGLQQMDDKALSEAFNQPETEAVHIRKRLQSAVDQSKIFQNVYDQFNEKYVNPFNPRNYDAEKDPQAWNAETNSFFGFESARKDAILSTVLYGKTLERIESLTQDFVSDEVVKNANASDFTVMLDPALLNDEIETLQKEISVLSLGDQKQKKEASDKKDKREMLVQLRDMSLSYQMASMDAMKEMSAEEQKSMMFSNGSSVKNKRTGKLLTVVESGDTHVRVMDKFGKKKRMSKKSLIHVVNPVRNRMREENQRMHKIFTKYIDLIAKQVGDKAVDQQKVTRSFIRFRDHMGLRRDANNFMRAANMLNNPEYFMQYARRMSEAHAVKTQNLPAYIRESAKAMFERHKNNEFLNEIYDLGLTIDPDDVELVIEDENYNVDLFNVNTGEKLSPDDPQFEKAQKVIEKYTALSEGKRNEREQEQDDNEEEDTDEEEAPPVQTGQPAETQPFKVGSKLYNDLVSIFRESEKEKEKNGESTFGLESTADELLITNDDFIEFTKTNNRAIRAIKNATETDKQTTVEDKEKKDWTPKPVPAGLEPLKNLFKKVLHLTKDEQNYVDKDGELFDRVSAMKPDKEELKAVSAIIKRRSVQRGNVIDKVIRDMFMGKIETKEDLLNIINTEIRVNKYEIDFNRQAVDKLFVVIGEIKKAADERGWKVHSDIPTLFGNYPGLKLPQKGKVAGTIDLLIEHNGMFFLVDIKSATRDRASEEGKDMYFDSDTIQLNVYREIIEQMTGVKIEAMLIFPITVQHGPRYKTVEDINAPSFTQDSLIPIPIVPVKQLVPELFEKGPETPPAAPAAPVSDIEKAKKLKMEWGNLIAPKSREVSEMLKSVYDFLNANFNWGLTDLRFSKSKNALIFSIGDKTFSVEAQIGKMANAPYISNSLEEIVNAKYDAELAALGAAPVTPVVTKSAEDLVREMLSSDGRMYTEFTVEEQKLIDNLPTERKLEIQKEIEEAGNKQKKKFKGDELQKMIDGAKDPAGYEKLQKALFRILSSNPHFRDHFNLNAERVKQILAEKYNQLAMTFVKEDIKKDIYVKTKDGRDMRVVNVTNDTFTIAPIDPELSEQTERYSMSKAYDTIESLYKEGMESIKPPVTPASDVVIENSTEKVSDNSVQNGQLTAEKVNKLNEQVGSKSQEEIDNNVLRTLCD